MCVSLSIPLEKYINKKVKSGMYNSVSEVIREGLRNLQEKELEKERKEKLDTLLMERLAKYEAGEKGIPLEEVRSSILQSLKEARSQ